MEHDDLIIAGVEDFLTNKDSYANRYYRGVLLSNNIIAYNDIEGNEGLIGTVISKIKQFVSWLWKKLTSIFKTLFVKETHVHWDEIKATDANAKLKPDAVNGAIRWMQLTYQNMHHSEQMLIDAVNKKHNPPDTIKPALTRLHIEDVDVYKDKAKDFKDKTDEQLSKMKDATTINEFSNVVKTFITNFESYFVWLIKHHLHYKPAFKNDYKDLSNVDDLTKEMEQDIKKVDESHQEAAMTWLTSTATISSVFMGRLADTQNNLKKLIEYVNSNAWYEKK